MEKIDAFDKKLLALLEENARMPLTQIAKRLRSSQQVVSYRIHTLENKGVIGGYYSVINISALGYTSYRTMIRLTNSDNSVHEKVISYLIKHGNVLWLVDCGGKWDLLVNFMAKNILDYNKILREFKNEFPEHIQNYEILTTVEVLYLGRDYLANGKRIGRQYSFGKYDNNGALDKLDYQILSFLSEKGRMNAVDIAHLLKISPNTVILRMRSLQKEGILQGFKPVLHLENFGYQGYKALIKFHNITEKDEEKIIEYLQKDIRIVGAIRLVGGWDFEIEFEVDSQEEMLTLTRTFRDSFKEVIKEFEVLPLFHEYKYNFFPRDLLK